MPKHLTSDQIAALLKILDTAERTIDERPISNGQNSTELRDDARPGGGSVTTPDRNANRFVEQIEAAMTKFRVQGR
jgi:hypothetical protein